MIDNYKFDDMNIPRPAGGFEYQEFNKTRGSGENDTQKTIADLTHAIELNDKNAKASEYLGTYYLLGKGDLQKANEAYSAAFLLDSTNAAILNDQGVLAWHEENLDLAEKKFALAIQYDSHFAEAQYNLALLYQQRGQKQFAIEAWKRYLEIDNKSDWKIIAETHLEKLMQK
jgi:tetratricopeptide (TPR) repeat protein